jgi:hypothetical protein
MRTVNHVFDHQVVPVPSHTCYSERSQCRLPPAACVTWTCSKEQVGTPGRQASNIFLLLCITCASHVLLLFLLQFLFYVHLHETSLEYRTLIKTRLTTAKQLVITHWRWMITRGYNTGSNPVRGTVFQSFGIRFIKEVRRKSNHHSLLRLKAALCWGLTLVSS